VTYVIIFNVAYKVIRFMSVMLLLQVSYRSVT
jgi:hypothetical protein